MQVRITRLVSGARDRAMLIAGSVAIVTGGARGLGRAYCEALLDRHAKVCFGDINDKEGRQTEATLRRKYGEGSVLFVRCDVTNDRDFRNLFSAALQKFHRIDLVVNNAGIMDESLWNKEIEVNLLGTIRGSNLAIEHMRKDKGGNGGLIVNIASSGGLFPTFFMPSYAASKYGVVGFTRSWASNPSLGNQYGVKMAVFCPGTTATDILPSFDVEEDPKVVTFSQNKEKIREFVFGFGLSQVHEVAEAFVNLVEKEDNNGAVVTVMKKLGTQYRFTKHPHKL